MMNIHFKHDQVLYVVGDLGRLHRVTAVFNEVDAANTYMATAPGEAVIAVFGPAIFIAAVDDLGISVPSTAQA
jgi:hypothetical protein